VSYLPKSGQPQTDAMREPMAGGNVANATPPGRADLADWIELMEAVEALCPVWPVVLPSEHGGYKL